MEQFSSASTPEQPVTPMPEESQAEFSKSSESNSHDLPGLRPLDNDLIKHEHHEKKPDLSIKPPPVQMGTQSPSAIQADISPPQEFTSSPPQAPSPPVESSAQAVPLPAPPVPPPASPVPPPALDVPPPAPAVPAPAPADSPPSPSSTQMDMSNQMFQSMDPSAVPMMPQPQYFGPTLFPLASVPLPMFLPGNHNFSIFPVHHSPRTQKLMYGYANISRKFLVS